MIIAEEFAKAGVPTGGPNDVFGIQMLGNTLLMWGTDEQKAHYLPRILSGDDRGARGTPSPTPAPTSAASALRAELDGDQWVLNGQKIWTSAGHLADHIFTLARTDPDAPKHKGISFLLVDMRQPGIEVRPIRMISGESEFNEVFYTDAVCPKDERRRRRQQRLGGGDDAARLRARRGGGDDADPVPGRARPAVRAGHGARRRPTTR